MTRHATEPDHIEFEWMTRPDTPFGDLLEHLYLDHGFDLNQVVDDMDELVEIHRSHHEGSPS